MERISPALLKILGENLCRSSSSRRRLRAPLVIGGSNDDGVRLAYEAMRVQDIFVAMLESRRFEVCEFSLANYLTLRSTGHDWLTAVPVFPYRAFRHGLAVTRRDSALTSLTQLSGKRIGVEDYSMTAAVWFRGLLEDEYGVDPRSITWVTRRKQRSPSRSTPESIERCLSRRAALEASDAMLGFSLKDACCGGRAMAAYHHSRSASRRAAFTSAHRSTPSCTAS